MGGKSRFAGVEHVHWVQKQLATARGEINTRPKGKRNKEKENQTCYNCGKTKFCKIFIAMRSKDVYSAGGTEGQDCKNWEPRKQPKGKSKKEINSLLKQFKKMRG